MLRISVPQKTFGLLVACSLIATATMAAPYAGLVKVPDRGGNFFGTPERFNRYYTDPTYKPARILHVSPSGNGDGGLSSPMRPEQAFSQARAGDEILFHDGRYAVSAQESTPIFHT